MPRLSRPSSRRGAPAADIVISGFSRDWIGRYLGGAERRRVTILTCGIASGCSLTKIDDPEELAAAICELRKQFRSIVEDLGGHVDGRPGLAVSAYWGYPRVSKDDTRLAVLAALQLAATRVGGEHMSCAIDCGLVIAGVAAEGPERAELVGPALHRTGQLLAITPAGSVVVTQTVRELIEDAFVIVPFDLAEGCWRVLDARPSIGPGVRPDRLELVGRSKERWLLEEIWQRVLTGQPQCVSICGEAGIGKSTLLRSLHSFVKTAQGFWFEIDCRPETRRAALHPVRESLRGLLMSRDGGLAPYMSCLADSERELVARFLGLRGPAADRRIEANVSRESRLTSLLLEWRARLSATAPLAIVFEDLHWADSATLQLLQMIGKKLPELATAALVCTTRDREICGLKTAARRTRLELERLSLSEVGQLLTSHPFGAALSPGLREQIALRSEGIPLFAGELARLFCSDSRRNEDDMDLLLEPGPLNMVLSARLDALGELKPLAQAASIFGRECDAKMLARVLDMDPSQLDRCLAELVHAGVLEPVARRGQPPPHIFRFSHALLRDAAYASVLKSPRRELHRRVAEVMAHEVGREPESCPEIIAQHYSRAGDQKGAFTWWFKAGRRAMEISATRASVEHLRRALCAREQDPEAGSPEEEIELLRALGLQLAALKGNGAPEVMQTLQRCLDLSRLIAGSTLDFDASWVLHSCYLVRGDVRKALKIGERLLTELGEAASDERRLKTHRMVGLAKMLAGRLQEAFVHYRLVLETYDVSRHAELRFQHASDQGALAHAHLAWAEAIAGRLESSAGHAEAALALASRLQHPHSSAHVVCVLAARAQTLGDRQGASALAFTGKALGERHEFPYWSAWADLILGWAEADRAADSVIGKAIDAYRRTGAMQALPYALLLRGEARLADGRAEHALSVLDEAWRIARERGLMLYAAEILRQQAIARQRIGTSATDAKALARNACQLARSQGAHLFRRRAAQLLESMGSWDRSLSHPETSGSASRAR